MNILWICTDQQRYDSLGCYGNPVVETPNLDALAAGGAVFDNCYSQSPVCSPSRGAFLTGRYPRTCGMRQNGAFIREDEVLVTKVLADSGYVVGLSGKLHLNPCNPAVCPGMEKRIQDGYSAFYWSHHPDNDWALNDYSLWLSEKGAAYSAPKYDDSRYIQRGMPQELHQTTYCTERAQTFIRACAEKKKPWAFTVNYFDPHHAFDPPEALMQKYMDKLDQIELPNYVEGELGYKPIFQQIDHKGAYGGNAGHPFTEMDEQDHKMHRAAYYAMVDLIDQNVGALMETLKVTGQLDDTVVIFTSDHGEMLGDHGIYLKGPYFYDCAIKVPLIIWQPKCVRARRVSALVELMDLAPTVLDIANLPHPAGMQARSLWPICTGQAPANHHRDMVYAEYYNAMPWHQNPQAHCTMVCDGHYKLVSCHGTGTGELYDLRREPSETTNLWSDPASIIVKADMLTKLSDVMAFTCDPLSLRVSPW